MSCAFDPGGIVTPGVAMIASRRGDGRRRLGQRPTKSCSSQSVPHPDTGWGTQGESRPGFAGPCHPLGQEHARAGRLGQAETTELGMAPSQNRRYEESRAQSRRTSGRALRSALDGLRLPLVLNQPNGVAVDVLELQQMIPMFLFRAEVDVDTGLSQFLMRGRDVAHLEAETLPARGG